MIILYVSWSAKLEFLKRAIIADIKEGCFLLDFWKTKLRC